MFARNLRIKIMNIKELEKKGFEKAAKLARGDCLQQMYIICENQKSINTRKLNRMLDECGEILTYYAQTMADLTKELSKFEDKLK